MSRIGVVLQKQLTLLFIAPAKVCEADGDRHLARPCRGGFHGDSPFCPYQTEQTFDQMPAPNGGIPAQLANFADEPEDSPYVAQAQSLRMTHERLPFSIQAEWESTDLFRPLGAGADWSY